MSAPSRDVSVELLDAFAAGRVSAREMFELALTASEIDGLPEWRPMKVGDAFKGLVIPALREAVATVRAAVNESLRGER